MAKRALIILSEGCEDIETVAPIDILTRAGVEVTIASLIPGPIKAAYGNVLNAHTTVDQVKGEFDAIVLPGGGKNAANLAADRHVIDMIKTQYKSGRLVAALCASPGSVLAQAADILHGVPATGDPGFSDRLLEGGAVVTNEDVTVSGNIITGRGPAAAIAFSLAVADYLGCDDAVQTLAEKWRVGRISVR